MMVHFSGLKFSSLIHYILNHFKILIIVHLLLVTGVSSSGRQRRIGHSGPPTGDFQLHSASDDDDDDSDSELMRAAERSRRSR